MMHWIDFTFSYENINSGNRLYYVNGVLQETLKDVVSENEYIKIDSQNYDNNIEIRVVD